jgi:hypothetical protein
MHVRLRERLADREAEELLLQEAVELARADGYLFTRSKYVLAEEVHCPPPSIRVAVSAAHAATEVSAAARVLALAVGAAIARVHGAAPDPVAPAAAPTSASGTRRRG